MGITHLALVVVTQQALDIAEGGGHHTCHRCGWPRKGPKGLKRATPVERDAGDILACPKCYTELNEGGQFTSILSARLATAAELD